MGTFRPTHNQLARWRRNSDKRRASQHVAYCRECATAIVYFTPAPPPERCPKCEQAAAQAVAGR